MSQLLQSALRSGATFEALATSYIDQGIPFTANGNIAYENLGPIDHYHQGLPFTVGNRLSAAINGTVTRIDSGGAPFNAAGFLCISNVTRDRVSAGIPYTANQQVTSG